MAENKEIPAQYHRATVSGGQESCLDFGLAKFDRGPTKRNMVNLTANNSAVNLTRRRRTAPIA
jgi:hypothetical protein